MDHVVTLPEVVAAVTALGTILGAPIGVLWRGLRRCERQHLMCERRLATVEATLDAHGIRGPAEDDATRQLRLDLGKSDPP